VKYTEIFINNEWRKSRSGKTFDTINPTNLSKIATVQEGDKADIDLAVSAAKEAFAYDSEWRSMDASNRGRLLYKLADLVEQNLEYVAKLESTDNGKLINEARGDIQLAINEVRYYAGWADKIHGYTLPADGNVVSMTRVEPVGVVGGILPWNFPFHLACIKLGPALAAGCTMVLKPAEQTPLTALLLAAYCKEVGFPKGVVNVVPGYGPTAGGALLEHPDVDKVSFTGSTEVGRLIVQGSSAVNLKRVTLELGGKSPLIICADTVDLDAAVAKAYDMATFNKGECCVAATRTFVEEGIYEEFCKKSKQYAEKRVVGDPLDEKSQQGPQVDDIQTEKIMDLIESGKKEGAKLLTGGERITSMKGYFVQPTVFANVTDNMRIAKEEIFGPVQSILKFKTLDEAIARANDTKYGLGAGIFTGSPDKALVAAQRLKAGSVWVNTYMHVTVQTPFGGFKESGLGRELGPYGLDAYLEKKTITMAISKKVS
jgi:acyl-CoA reductase-like NAD-dependent aldehyde dehydrogenase